jgi:ABC-type molybdate transport system substrate-binding protein
MARIPDQSLSPGPPIRLSIFAVVSLRRALREFAALPGTSPADMTFDFSGALRDRILSGERADIFLAGDRTTPQTVAEALIPADGTVDHQVTGFAFNTLVGVARPDVGLTEANFFERMLDPQVRLGICMPGRDAAGDAALRLFAAAEQMLAGAAATLAGKVRVVFSRSDQGSVVVGPEQAMRVLSAGEADIILILKSWARSLIGVMDVQAPPPALALPIEHCLLVLPTDPVRRALADSFVASLLAPAGQTVLMRHGFEGMRTET